MLLLFVIVSCESEPYVLQSVAYPEGAGITIPENQQYSKNQTVSLIAIPNPGYMFVRWEGTQESISRYLSLTINQNHTMVAIFAEDNFTCGDSIADIDGNSYRTTKIGEQCWMAENLRVSRYRDGWPIPMRLGSDWVDAHLKRTDAYMIYQHRLTHYTDKPLVGIHSDKEMAEAYGKFYNWYAVSNDRGLCPVGWRIPSNDDWTHLSGFIGTRDDVYDPLGRKLMSRRQVNSFWGAPWATDEHPRWRETRFRGTPDFTPTDEFGFSALPSGYRIGEETSWWSSTIDSSRFIWKGLEHYLGKMNNTNVKIRKLYWNGNFSKGHSYDYNGHSVRCILD